MGDPQEITDDEIRNALTAINDSDEVSVSEWEEEFIQNVLFEWKGKLTQAQREKAVEIIERYEPMIETMSKDD